VTAESQYFDIVSTKNSTKIWQNSKSLLGRSIETRTSRLVKKTGVEKSRWTVPLRYLDIEYITFVLYRTVQPTFLFSRLLRELSSSSQADADFAVFPLRILTRMVEYLNRLGVLISVALTRPAEQNWRIRKDSSPLGSLQRWLLLVALSVPVPGTLLTKTIFLSS
jgi:hypothetical protein